MIFSIKISKGHNSANSVGGVTVLILCTLSDIDLLLYLCRFLSCSADTIFILIISERHNSVKN